MIKWKKIFFDNYWKNLEAQSPEQNLSERRKYNSWKDAL